jgi:2-phospho-L-lactate guanylyltransferase
VAVVPVGAGFRFAYGPGSHARHVAEAQRLGLPWRSLPDPDLGWDVDEPADLEFQPSK